MAERYAGPVPCGACGKPLPPEVDGIARCPCGKEVRVFRFRPFRRDVSPTPFSAASGAPCAYHAGNLAVCPCARCGSFLCDLCATPLEGKTYCPPCFERILAAGTFQSLRNQFPRPHAIAAALAFLALIPFAAVVAIPLAVWQMGKAWRKRSELAQRESRVGLYLFIAILLCCLGLLITVRVAMAILDFSG